MPINDDTVKPDAEHARREFLRAAGKFAVVTPPIMATMLSVTATPALASGSGGGGGADGQSDQGKSNHDKKNKPPKTKTRGSNS